MKSRLWVVLLLLLMPAVAFGQTVEQKYKEARAAEYRSDKAKTAYEKDTFISESFDAITEAVSVDPKYVEAFTQIARKHLQRSIEPPYFFMTESVLRVGLKRRNEPAFKQFVAEYLSGYKKMLLGKGYAPSKPFVQNTGRNRYHCNVPHDADQIFHLSQLIYPKGTKELNSWGKYAADLYMRSLRGCGGEGADDNLWPNLAFPIYVAIGDRTGMHKAGKMLGDDSMEQYIFGERSSSHYTSLQKDYVEAMKFYNAGGVTKEEIRDTILVYLRRAEKEKDTNAIKIAKAAFAKTF